MERWTTLPLGRNCNHDLDHGLVLGVLAIRRRENRGTSVGLHMTVVGIILNLIILGQLLFLIISAMHTREAKRARSSQVQRASEAYNAKLQEVRDTCQHSFVALSNPPVLDPAAIESQTDLKSREELVNAFIKTSQDLLDLRRTRHKCNGRPCSNPNGASHDAVNAYELRFLDPCRTQ